MAVKRGTDGLIQVSDDGGTTWVTVASQQSWSLDLTNSVVDTTVLGAQRWGNNLTTFGSWSFTFDGFWDDEDQAAAEGQGIIAAHAIDGEEFDVRVIPSATGGAPEIAGDWFWSGKAIVGDSNPTGSFDSAVQSSLTLQGRGALNYAEFGP